jgi:hypothetical protein
MIETDEVSEQLCCAGLQANQGEEKATCDTMQEKRHKFPLLVLILAISW